MKHVATCLTGQVRTLVYSQVQINLKVRKNENISIPFTNETCSISPACIQSLIWNPPCRNQMRHPCDEYHIA